jgi:hypothetical protein
MGVVMMFAMAVLVPRAAAASFPACGGTGNWHSGHRIPIGTVYGAVATIQYFNETLCAGNTTKSFSTSWTALEAVSLSDSNGWDIYQVGFMKCRTCGWPSTTTTYLVWAYGREFTTACGSAISPTPHRLGSAGIANVPFKVARGHDPDGMLVYQASVNGTVYDDESLASLDTCWPGGPSRTEYANEVGNASDQSGGTPTANQNWTSVKYMNSSSIWVAMNGTLNANCARIDLLTQRCKISSTLHDKFITWDTRG